MVNVIAALWMVDKWKIGHGHRKKTFWYRYVQGISCNVCLNKRSLATKTYKKLRAVHKRSLHKIAKNSPHPPSSALGQLLLSVQTHQEFRKIRSFWHQKVRTFASEESPLVRLDTPHPRVWTASYYCFLYLFVGLVSFWTGRLNIYLPSCPGQESA